MEIRRFVGREASVNAYIVQNSTHAIVIDSLRNRLEAAELAQAIRASGRNLQAIFVTHGHPDHYIGLRTLKESFPSARAFVASEAIKADMTGFSTWMEGVGWLDAQPQMKHKSSVNPGGFDYDSEVEVLHGDRLTLDGGGSLEVRTNYPATECAHMSTLFAREESTLLTGDLTYHGVHAWEGQGVLRDHLANWIRILGDLKAQYSDQPIAVLPGHGAPGNAELFDEMRLYLDDFLSAVDDEATNASALARMQRLYPAHLEAGFLLAQSIAFHGPDSRPKQP